MNAPLTNLQPTWKICLILALGAFSMGNAKYSIIQLIPIIAADLGTTTVDVQQAVIAYFWGGFIGAPLFAIFCRNWDKHKILVLLSIWCFLGNLGSSFANSAEMLQLLRFFSGIPHGAFLAFAVLCMAQTAPTQKTGWYVGLVLMGVAVATVLAAPFNAWVGETQSWQTAFRLVALLDILIALFIHDFLPDCKNTPPKTSLSELFASLKNNQVWSLLFIEACILASTTTIWSFSIPILSVHSEVPVHLDFIVTMILAIGFLCGQVLATYYANGKVHQHIAITCVAAIISCVLLWVFLKDYRWALVGVFFISSMPLINIFIQVRLLQIVPDNRYLIFCLNNSALFAGNFIGSLSAYLIMKTTATNHWIVILAMGFATLALLAWLYLNRHTQRQQPADAAFGSKTI